MSGCVELPTHVYLGHAKIFLSHVFGRQARWKKTGSAGWLKISLDLKMLAMAIRTHSVYTPDIEPVTSEAHGPFQIILCV